MERVLERRLGVFFAEERSIASEPPSSTRAQARMAGIVRRRP